jgi:hypothetical protein
VPIFNFIQWPVRIWIYWLHWIWIKSDTKTLLVGIKTDEKQKIIMSKWSDPNWPNSFWSGLESRIRSLGQSAFCNLKTHPRNKLPLLSDFFLMFFAYFRVHFLILILLLHLRMRRLQLASKYVENTIFAFNLGKSTPAQPFF